MNLKEKERCSKLCLLEYVRIYFMMIGQDFKSKMQYRADFIISSLAILMTNVLGIISFRLVFNAVPSIGGYSYDEMIFIYSFALLAQVIPQLFFDNLWWLSGTCEDGSFLKYCLKPVNTYFYFVAEVFDPKGIGQLIFSVIMMIISWGRLGIPVTFLNVGVLLLTLLGASMLLAGIMTLSCSMSFVTLHGHTVMNFMMRFRDYGRYPTSIFSKLFRFVFTYILPIGFICFYPSLYFLRPEANKAMAVISPLVGLFVFVIGYKVWMRLAMKYAGTGT